MSAGHSPCEPPSHVEAPFGVQRSKEEFEFLVRVEQAPGVVGHEATPPRTLHTSSPFPAEHALERLAILRNVLQVYWFQLIGSYIHLRSSA